MSKDREWDECEFCNEKRKTVSTIFFGFYCQECIEIVIEISKEALEEIKNQPK